MVIASSDTNSNAVCFVISPYDNTTVKHTMQLKESVMSSHEDKYLHYRKANTSVLRLKKMKGKITFLGQSVSWGRRLIPF